MNHNATARAARGAQARLSLSSVTGYLLRGGMAAALIIDAVVHVRGAYSYAANVGALLNQGELFGIEAAAAVIAATAVLLSPRRLAWLLAFGVTASAFAAVVLSTSVNVGALVGLPNMYEPSWAPPGKLISAIAEGAGVLLALGGLAWARRRRQD